MLGMILEALSHFGVPVTKSFIMSTTIIAVFTGLVSSKRHGS